MSLQSAVPPSDREAIALIEVGHTTIAPTLARIVVGVFLVALAALPAVEWLGGRRTGAEPSRVWSRLLELPGAIVGHVPADGAGTPPVWGRIVAANRVAVEGFSAFETALEDESPVGLLLRPPAQYVMSGWLGVGNERVYAGRDGWLFYRQDVDSVIGRGFLDARQIARRAAADGDRGTAPASDPRPAVLQFARDLAARGIALVVVPTPVKPTVHPERLARAEAERGTALTPVQNASYAAFVEGLRHEGVLVFDPAEVIARWRAETSAPAYLATDTHWRPEAMQRVAEALVKFLGTHATLPPVPRPGYRVEPREARHLGDTAAMLDLPRGQTLYPPERVSLRFVVGANGDPWQSSRDADILMLGDSFSNMYALATMGWGEAAGLVEQVSYLLQRPIDRIVQNDDGAHASRALLARDAGDRLRGKRVVIWQFAARELAFGDWRVIPLR